MANNTIDAAFDTKQEQRTDEDDDKTLADYRIQDLTKRIDRLSPRRQLFYPVLYDFAPSLLAQSYLDPHARLYHFRGKASISSDKSDKRSEKLKRDDDEIEIVYREISANQIEVRYGSPNPFAQNSYLTQGELRQVIEAHTGFEDLVIKQRGITHSMPQQVRQRIEKNHDTENLDLSTVYHHESSISLSNNESRMGFETVDVSTEIREVLRDMDIPEDDLGTIGRRIRSLLKTDYTLMDGPFDHRLFAQNDSMKRLIRSISANHPWQDVGNPESTEFGNQNIRWYQLENTDGSVIV
jgi:hypothetical protein